jgi:putative transcription factor
LKIPPFLPSRHNHVTHEFKIALQQARAAKGMTQKDLATAICEKPSVITDYESGRAIPNGQIITKLNRVLGAKLSSKMK